MPDPIGDCPLPAAPSPALPSSGPGSGLEGTGLPWVGPGVWACGDSLALPVLQMELAAGVEPDGQDLPSDSEFEGQGDYEEGFFAEWWQEPKSKGDKADQGY